MYSVGFLLVCMIEVVYWELMSGSFVIECFFWIGYFGLVGLEGYFVVFWKFGVSVDLEDFYVIEGVFEEVVRSYVDYGFVLIENSGVGSVKVILDFFV